MRNRSLFAILVLCLGACHESPHRGLPDLSIRKVVVGLTRMEVKEDKSWLRQPVSDIVGFRVRIQYDPGRRFSLDQNNLMNFGIQDGFTLVKGGDTLHPVFFQRIAGAQAAQAEYVMAFPSPKGDASRLRLLFQDPLFGLGDQGIDF